MEGEFGGVRWFSTAISWLMYRYRSKYKGVLVHQKKHKSNRNTNSLIVCYWFWKVLSDWRYKIKRNMHWRSFTFAYPLHPAPCIIHPVLTASRRVTEQGRIITAYDLTTLSLCRWGENRKLSELTTSELSNLRQTFGLSFLLFARKCPIFLSQCRFLLWSQSLLLLVGEISFFNFYPCCFIVHWNLIPIFTSTAYQFSKR